MYDFLALPPPCKGSFCPVNPQTTARGTTRCKSCPGQYAFDGRMMLIGNFSTFETDNKYMSKAALEAAYGLVGFNGVSSFAAKSTAPYNSDVPIWMNR